jgi:hypothetical protein
MNDDELRPHLAIILQALAIAHDGGKSRFARRHLQKFLFVGVESRFWRLVFIGRVQVVGEERGERLFPFLAGHRDLTPQCAYRRCVSLSKQAMTVSIWLCV